MKIELQAVLNERLFERDRITGRCYSNVVLESDCNSEENYISLFAEIPGDREVVFSKSKYYTVTITPNVAANFEMVVGIPSKKT